MALGLATAYSIIKLYAHASARTLLGLDRDIARPDHTSRPGAD